MDKPINKNKDPRINLLNRLKIQLSRHVYVGDIQEDGWDNPLPQYAFKCPKHGIVYDYPHGYNQRLECPICRTEIIEEKVTEIRLKNKR